MMTLSQVAWAMEHDWYYYTGTCSVTGKRTVYVWDVAVSGGVIPFNNFKALRKWAGY